MSPGGCGTRQRGRRKPQQGEGGPHRRLVADLAQLSAGVPATATCWGSRWSGVRRWRHGAIWRELHKCAVFCAPIPTAILQPFAMMQVTHLPHTVCPRGCRLPARGQRQASRPAAAADTAESATAAASVEGAIYDGVFPKPLGVKFARGSDGGAYVISKSAEEAYAQFNVGDKILEVRRVFVQLTHSGKLAASKRGGLLLCWVLG